MYDIIIVGAGTAGLTAAIYGVRAGKSVLVLEARKFPVLNMQKICMSRQRIWEQRFILNRLLLLKRQNPKN